MNIGFGHTSRLWALGLTLVALGASGGCLSDSGGSGGTAATGGSGGSGTTGTVCASPIVLPASKPAIATFEEYDGSADLSTWSFPLGGDSATGIFAGSFGYGDEADGFPEAFAMVAGNDASSYALSISDTLAEEYGGGMGLWISECLDATAFSGISFWVRGNSPTGDAKLTLLMEETTSATADMADEAVGTCAGTDTTCIHPNHVFDVTDEWTEVRVSWADFVAGDAAGTMVEPDGHNVWQIQFDIGLVWAANEGGVYEPTPAPYELVIDDLTFY